MLQFECYTLWKYLHVYNMRHRVRSILLEISSVGRKNYQPTCQCVTWINHYLTTSGLEVSFNRKTWNFLTSCGHKIIWAAFLFWSIPKLVQVWSTCNNCKNFNRNFCIWQLRQLSRNFAFNYFSTFKPKTLFFNSFQNK